MAEKCQNGTGSGQTPRTVHVHTRRIHDACMDKDCVEELRVYLTRSSQQNLERATAAKARCAELLYAHPEVEALPYSQGKYAVDLTFYYRVIGDAILCGTRPTTVYGLAVFTKRIVLCAGCSRAKIFSSANSLCELTHEQLAAAEMPTAVVEALDPMVLSARVREACECRRSEPELCELPQAIRDFFDEELAMNGESKRLYVTLGQFSTVRLERETQLLLPICDYSVPSKTCCDTPECVEDPCDLFAQIAFPMAEFFPSEQNCDSTAQPCACQ